MCPAPFFKYLLALLLFGSNGVVASAIALSSCEIVLVRTMLGSALLLALFFLTGNRLRFFRHGAQGVFLAVSGIAMGTSWMFLYEAYSRIGVGVASLLYYCGPVVVMVLSPLLFRERLTAPKITGFCGVLLGVVLVNSVSFAGGSDPFGIFCALMSALMYAVMVIFNKKAKDIPGLENSTVQLTVSFLTVAAFVALRQGLALTIPRESLGAILVLGLLNTGVGCYLYFSSIGALAVQTVAVCGYLEPLSAVVFSVLVLGERLTPAQLLGAALIIGGAVFAEQGSRQKSS